MNTPLKVVIVGLGAMGSGMVDMILNKTGLELAGAVAARSEKHGKDVGELINRAETGVKVSRDLEQVIKDTNPDLVLHTKNSYTNQVYSDVKQALMKGVNVISIAEEMSYPKVHEPDLTKELHRIAKEYNVTVLGTGVNPGFVLDTLILNLTGACIDIDHIYAARINDLSPFGTTVMQSQGVGTTITQFNQGLIEGSIVGHVGFPESINMIADALGLVLDDISEEREPIISSTYRETPYITIKPGMVAGCRHIGTGIKDGKEIIKLEHPQEIRPDKEGIDTGDYINITGTPNINMAIQPEIPGGMGTIAIAVNMIPQVIMADSGVLSMYDLHIPRGIYGDLSNTIRRHQNGREG